MELLLTPILTRLLKRFVKSSAEGGVPAAGGGGGLKASLTSRGGITLHDLELNLDSLLARANVTARRAFAKRLHVVVPWTALTSQPIRVVLEGVELVAVQGGAPPPAGDAAAAADAAAGGGWLGGALRSLALRAGLNVAVQVNGVVLQYIQEGDFAATALLGSLAVATAADDDWQELLQNPLAWLKKEFRISGLSVSLDPHAGGGGGGGASFAPVLQTQEVSVAALFPIFAFLEGADPEGDDLKATVAVRVEPVDVAANDWQVDRVRRLAALFAEQQQEARGAGAAAPPAGAPYAAMEGQGEAASAVAMILGSAAADDRAGSGDYAGGLASPRQPARPQMAALGAFGRLWDFLVDESTYLESIEDELGVEPAPRGVGDGGGLPMRAELDVLLAGGSVLLSRVASSSREGLARPTAALALFQIQALEARVTSVDNQLLSVGLSLQGVSLARSVPRPAWAAVGQKAEPLWDEVLGLHANAAHPGQQGACFVQWRAADDGGGQAQCMARFGQLVACHAPGFLERLRGFAAPAGGPARALRAAENGRLPLDGAGGSAQPRGAPAVAGSEPSSPVLRMLQSGILLDAQLSVLQLAALSSQEELASALLLSAQGLQCRSGVDGGAVDGELTASIEGVTLAAVPVWTHARSRADQEALLGCAPVSNSFTIQGTLGVQGGALQALVEVLPIQLILDAVQLAAAKAAATGAGPHAAPGDHWLKSLGVSVGSMRAVYSSAGVSADLVDACMSSSPGQALLHADISSVVVEAFMGEPTARAAALLLRAELHRPQCCAQPGFALSVPGATVSLGPAGAIGKVEDPLILAGFSVRSGVGTTAVRLASLSVAPDPATVASLARLHGWAAQASTPAPPVSSAPAAGGQLTISLDTGTVVLRPGGDVDDDLGISLACLTYTKGDANHLVSLAALDFTVSSATGPSLTIARFGGGEGSAHLELRHGSDAVRHILVDVPPASVRLAPSVFSTIGTIASPFLANQPDEPGLPQHLRLMVRGLDLDMATSSAASLGLRFCTSDIAMQLQQNPEAETDVITSMTGLMVHGYSGSDRFVIMQPADIRLQLLRPVSPAVQAMMVQAELLSLRYSLAGLAAVRAIVAAYSSSDFPEDGAAKPSQADASSDGLQVASFTLAFAVSHVQVELIAPAEPLYAGDPLAQPGAVGVLQLAAVEAAMHSWSGPASAKVFDIGAEISMEYMDTAAMTAVQLLDPFLLRACLERSDDSVARPDGRTHPLPDSPLGESLVAMLNRRRPNGAGLSLAVDVPREPLAVNFSELTLHELKRLLAVLRSEAPAPPPLLLINDSGMDLAVRQVGCQHVQLLRSGSTSPYRWSTAPLFQESAERALQVAVAGDGELAWSEPLEVLAVGCDQLVLPPCPTSDSDRHLGVSVLVQRGRSVEVTFQPGLRVVNHLPTPVRCIITDDGKAPSAEADVVLDGSGGSCDTLMTYARSLPSQQDRSLRIEFAEHHSASLSLTSLQPGATPVRMEHAMGSSVVVLNVVPPDVSTGQVTLELWPAAYLVNQGPCPVLVQACDGAMHRVAPGAAVPLPAPPGGGPFLRLGLGATGAEEAARLSAAICAPAPDGGAEPVAGLALAPPGRALTLAVPYYGGAADGSTVLCRLVSEELREGLPVLRLCLCPALVAHNRLPVEVAVQVGSAAAVVVPPGGSVPLAGSAGAGRAGADPEMEPPPTAVVSLAGPANLDDGAARFQSQPFPFAESGDVELALDPAPPPGAGGLWAPLVARRCILAARIGVHRHPASGDAAATIAVEAGCYFSNMTEGLDVAVRALGGVPLAPAGAEEAVIACGATVPLLCLWTDAPAAAAAAAVSPSELHRRKPSWGVELVQALDSPAQGGATAAAAGGLHGRVQLALAAGAKGAPAGPQGRAWSGAVSLADPAWRRRLYLKHPSTRQPVMLTYRLVQHGQRRHLVLFRDRQPPCVVENLTAGALEVGLSARRGGAVAAAVRVGAGLRVECDVPAAAREGPPAGGDGGAAAAPAALKGGSWEDEEDENAFQECLAAAGDEDAVAEPPVLHLRAPGSQDWVPVCDLVPGEHACKAARVAVGRVCATTHVALRPPGAAPAAAAALPPATVPWRLSLRCRQLQLCLWDDDRRRLLGRGGDEGGEDEPAAGRALGSEVVGAYVDGLQLELSKTVGPGDGGARATYDAAAAAAALHVDAYVPGAEYPVLLTSLLEPAGGEDEEREREPAQALRVAAQVVHAPGPADAPPSFRNAWLERLEARLPRLAVAVDDGMLLFAERAQQLLFAPAPAPRPAAAALAAGGGGGGPPPPGALGEELRAEASAAAASRLYIGLAVVEPVRLLLDVHLSRGVAGSPVAIDAHRAPLGLSRIAAAGALFRPRVLLRGLAAHCMAEALLSAPQVLGSMQLLFNPTGLVRSLRDGVADLVGLPLAALRAGSAVGVLVGLGAGSASLARHISGWTLNSIAGFSQAAARAIDSAGGALAVVGLPVSGALGIVGAVSSELAASVGVSATPPPRREPRALAAPWAAAAPARAPAAPGVAAAALLAQPQLAAAAARTPLGAALAHCATAAAAVGGRPLRAPLVYVLLTERALAVFEVRDGLALAALLLLKGEGAAAQERRDAGELAVRAPSALPAAAAAGHARLRLRRPEFLLLTALLRHCVALRVTEDDD